LAGLAPADIARVRDAAVGYWSALDAEAAQRLSTTQVVIADLPATLLGLASASTQTVWLDAEAAGFGWQVEAESRERRAESQSHYDSLTVLTHEFGHVLGYDDLDPWPESSAIMTGVLPPAARRVPTDEGLGRGSSSRSHNAQRSTLNSAVDGWFLDVGRSATIFEPGRRPEPEREAVSSDWVISSRQSKKDEELLELLARARTSGEREAAPDGLFADLGADEA
jgi:hypothetical protein